MRYELRAVGSRVPVEIDQAAYVEAARAKKALGKMIAIEQKFDLVFQNYFDYERELLELSLRYALHLETEWQGFQNDIAAVSRRLANLLSAARLYVDQVAHDLSDVFGQDSELPRLIEAKKREQYDSRFGYRVMDALRNAMQHRVMPVYALSYPGESRESGAEFRAVPSINPSRLKDDAKFKRTVLTELEARGEDVPLTPLVREYVEGLGIVHEVLRERAAEQVASWDSVLSSAQARGAAALDGNPKRAVLATHFDDGGNVVETVQIFTDLIHYRRAFETRNRLLSNLARRYVSSSSRV